MNKIQRILSLLLSLLMILIVGFILVNKIPGDKIQGILSQKNNNAASDNQLYEKNYTQLYQDNYFNKPLFYISWASLAVPDSFNYLPFENQRRQLIALSSSTGNPNSCYAYIQYLYGMNVYESAAVLQPIEKEVYTTTIYQLKNLNNVDSILDKLNYAQIKLGSNTTIQELNHLAKKIDNNQQYWKNFIPQVKFQTENQFHFWLVGNENRKGLLQGNFGNSIITNADVYTTIKRPFITTLTFSLFSILLALSITIPAAILLVYFRNKKVAKLISNALLYLNGFPVFLTASLLLLLFANPNFLSLFPSSVSSIFQSSNDTKNWSFTYSIYILFLPVVAYIFSPTAAFIKILTGNLEFQLQEEYIKTARAKGLAEFKVIYKHALRLSVIPLLTIALYSFPVMLGGTIIIEAIFNINGLGLICIRSILNHDYSIAVAVFLILGIASILSFSALNYLLSKIDPRTLSSFKNNKLL
jgi:peptide/nickel transport system permease protein